jgi:protein Tob/BTG
MAFPDTNVLQTSFLIPFQELLRINSLVVWVVCEKGPVKILHSERRDEEITEKADREVQLSDRGFNPEAQCFKPIDSLSSSLSNLSLSPGGLSPSSPSSSSGWPGSNSTSPSSALFNSDMSVCLFCYFFVPSFAVKDFYWTLLADPVRNLSWIYPDGKFCW